MENMHEVTHGHFPVSKKLAGATRMWSFSSILYTNAPPNARSLYKGILIQQRPKSSRGNLRKDSTISESMFQISEMKMNPCNGRRVCQSNDVVALATRRNS